MELPPRTRPFPSGKSSRTTGKDGRSTELRDTHLFALVGGVSVRPGELGRAWRSPRNRLLRRARFVLRVDVEENHR